MIGRVSITILIYDVTSLLETGLKTRAKAVIEIYIYQVHKHKTPLVIILLLVEFLIQLTSCVKDVHQLAQILALMDRTQSYKRALIFTTFSLPSEIIA